MKSNKGRPAQISKEDVVNGALSIGLSSVTMNSLGKQLGVSATALYRHVSSKHALILMCSDMVLGKVALPEESDWEGYLYTFAERFRQALLSMPGSVEFVRHTQEFTPATNVLANDVLRVLGDAGFEPEIGFMAFASVYTRVTDLVEHQERSSMVKANETSSQENSEMLSQLDELPYLAKLLSNTQPLDYDQYFKDGIKITIEGLKAVYC
ncbi:TetR/AcrR family transcriptional regulator C-terminal domain-containing protein [Vibrio sp. SCSIO 43135]|uniref:TetR/AcrR family transcriptional regulator C-terminal domain-containing protein n=1 Tax=Vibrio sp. SCSIO 43135 TaxID=2819096 RepID=UPI0020757BAF|nr:TetR/AcrR family transcriptional regulator C-terminal domain-containing protein [Vibrio sp. SCSIO 43135]